MRIVSVGGGPAGLYLGILMKRADPRHQVVVLERNRADDTFGFGVVFSDATLENLGRSDPDSYAAIRRAFAHWDDIDIHWRGEVLRSTGHGFCGMERRRGSFRDRRQPVVWCRAVQSRALCVRAPPLVRLSV